MQETTNPLLNYAPTHIPSDDIHNWTDADITLQRALEAWREQASDSLYGPNHFIGGFGILPDEHIARVVRLARQRLIPTTDALEKELMWYFHAQFGAEMLAVVHRSHPHDPLPQITRPPIRATLTIVFVSDPSVAERYLPPPSPTTQETTNLLLEYNPSHIPSDDIDNWTDVDLGLQQALEAWREQTSDSLYGPNHFIGGFGVLPDDHVKRIVGLARRRLVSTPDDLRKELRWCYHSEFGEQVLAVVHRSHPHDSSSPQTTDPPLNPTQAIPVPVVPNPSVATTSLTPPSPTIQETTDLPLDYNPSHIPSDDRDHWTCNDVSLQQALETWRDQACESLYGPNHTIGGTGILSDEQIKRIVGLARRSMIATPADLRKELMWSFHSELGAQMLAVVHRYHHHDPLPTGPPIKYSPSHIPKNDVNNWTDADIGLQQALKVWREEACEARYGPYHPVGGLGILADSQVKRIVGLARRRLIPTTDDLQKELRWCFHLQFGAQMLAVVHKSHPHDPSPAACSSSTTSSDA